MSTQGESNHSPEIQWQTASPERWVQPNINPNTVNPPQSSRQSLKERILTGSEAPRIVSPEQRDEDEKRAAMIYIGSYIEELRHAAQHGLDSTQYAAQSQQPGEVIDMEQFRAENQRNYAQEVFDVETA